MAEVKRLVFDFDYIKYQIASVSEKREIVVTHKPSGREKVFDTRTSFYGHWKKKEGGWLGDLNKQRIADGKEPFLVEDFDIQDKQTPVPVSHMNQTVKNHINGVCEALKATSYYGYIGRGDSWRVDRSTLIKYKGNREGLIKPLMLDEIEDYLIKRHDAEVVTGLETDDQVVIDCVKNPNLILVGVDKDYMGVEGITFFNVDKMEAPYHIQGLGKLWLDDKGKVRGYGRKFFYWQLLAGDTSDNYFANSATDTEFGEKGAYNALVDIPDDKGCWKAIAEIYKWLYPEPKKFVGWRGYDKDDKGKYTILKPNWKDFEFEIDWRYVLTENCDMAYMLRTKNDKFDLASKLEMIGEV